MVVNRIINLSTFCYVGNNRLFCSLDRAVGQYHLSEYTVVN